MRDAARTERRRRPGSRRCTVKTRPRSAGSTGPASRAGVADRDMRAGPAHGLVEGRRPGSQARRRSPDAIPRIASSPVRCTTRSTRGAAARTVSAGAAAGQHLAQLQQAAEATGIDGGHVAQVQHHLRAAAPPAGSCHAGWSAPTPVTSRPRSAQKAHAVGQGVFKSKAGRQSGRHRILSQSRRGSARRGREPVDEARRCRAATAAGCSQCTA